MKPDTPLFVKTHDFLLWLLGCTQRFPKHLRHSYTLKLALLKPAGPKEIIKFLFGVEAPLNAIQAARSKSLAESFNVHTCLKRGTLSGRVARIQSTHT